MNKIILIVFLSTIFLAPTLGIAPMVYDGQFYNHTVSLSNPYHQIVNDLQFTMSLDGYFDYVAIHPEIICIVNKNEMVCKIEQPSSRIEAGALVTIRTNTPEAPEIIWCERNFDSVSLPKLVVIRNNEQYNLFIPVMEK